MITGNNWQVHIGSNLDVLPTLPDNSVDSIVTDPPYELGFMGKKWDSSGIAYSTELWKECLRVLKPGGHLLSFGGTRTWHRVAVAIEDSGFEVRDSIAWMYGSGFPKSLDISKAIDKGTGENKQRQLKFVNWMRSTGITAKQINEATGTQMSSHYIGLSQPAIATAELFDQLRCYLPEVPEEIERLVAERTGIEWTAYKNREVIGQKTAGMGSGKTFGMLQSEGHNLAADKEINITAPSTPEAQQWEGWGTALKPAFEPIVVARKPLIGTVAQNVLTHGTGGLNIDGSRIGTETTITQHTIKPSGPSVIGNGAKATGESTVNPEGRWPANVILDPYTAELLDEQSGVRASGAFPKSATKRAGEHYEGGWQIQEKEERVTLDKGGASRFFYVAKASKRDRNEGLDELPTKGKVFNGQNPESAGMAEGSVEDKFTTQPAQNFHPTVKPTALMRYLVKLVTPPGGTVLDPFTGSGSTGKAAILEGFDFIGIELTEDYIPIIEGRLKHAVKTKAEEADKDKEQLF